MSRRRVGSPSDRPARRVSSAAGALAVLILLAGLFAWFAWAGPGPARSDTDVVLPRGSSVSEISKALQGSGVIRSAALFRVFAKVTRADRTLRAGEYDFPAHASLARVVRMMATGQIVRHWITVPEGRTSAQVAAELNASPVLTGTAEAPPEGALLPETYEVERGEDRSAVLASMREARDTLLADLWAKRAPGLPIKTPQEAVIMASIVEKETSVASERPRVAAVYENRLAKGMRLEADPVVIYGVSKGEALGRGLTRTELQTITPYNTYRVAGLPPTPIANPGRASLEAVLHPAKTDALFFVADGSGGHAFSSTWEEHSRNVARWRMIETTHKATSVKTQSIRTGR